MPERPTPPLRLVIADDHANFRAAIVSSLQLDPGLQVIGQGSDAYQAIGLAAELHPDLILLDITMAGNGLHAARTIAQQHPDIKIIMLTFSSVEDDIHEAFQAGVRAYVLKGVSGRRLRQVIHTVAGGESYLSPELIPPRDPEPTPALQSR